MNLGGRVGVARRRRVARRRCSAGSRSARPRGWLYAVALIVLTAAPLDAAAQVEVFEATITELQEAMSSGRTNAEALVRAHLARIEAYDQAGPRLNAMIRLNPRALADAQALDAERAARGPRGPLHGIPILLKDNYDLAGMPTTAGSIGLAGLMPPDDAFQVAALREAGAVILGKTNMHEMASGITTIGSLGGQTLNPYDPMRNPGGSSGGTGAAVAASFGVVGWGSDTCGSIRNPSAQNNLFGLRPTKGISSIDGIIPLSSTQDVGGPLARTVTDLAIALDATVGRDQADPATDALLGRELPRFAASLNALSTDEEAPFRGVRLGVLEELFGDGPEDGPAGQLVRDALELMEGLGAEIVEAEVPGLDSLMSGSGLIQHEFKWDLIDYLAGVPDAPARSLGEILDRGLVHEALVGSMRRRNAAEARDTEAAGAARAKRAPLRDAVVAAMDRLGVDALVHPTLNRPPARVGEPQRGSTCQLSAATGMPALSMPAGFTSAGLPIGLELLGRPFDDPRLLQVAYAFEQVAAPRVPPYSTPALVGGLAPVPVEFDVRAVGTAGVRATFAYDAVASELRYEVEVTGVASADIYAVALRRQDDEGNWMVARRLSGPQVARAAGRLQLNPALRERLLGGELVLELFTRADPEGAGGARLEVPGR